jgi:TRAP-type mannitol/chloroaromatic compound transport system substrate-binding protein
MDDRLIALSFGLLLAATTAASPALSQSANCASHDIVTERLADGYGESRQTIALGSGNTLVETWANLDTGTWTITVTQPGGPTCLVASGQAFELLAGGAPVDDQPA